MDNGPNPQTSVSTPYLVFMFTVGFGIIGVLIYAGFNHWNFWLTVLVGAVVQLVFRVIKRVWKKSLLPADAPAPDDADQQWTKQDVRNFLIAFPTLIAVCALWYGVGWGVDWLLS